MGDTEIIDFSILEERVRCLRSTKQAMIPNKTSNTKRPPIAAPITVPVERRDDDTAPVEAAELDDGTTAVSAATAVLLEIGKEEILEVAMVSFGGGLTLEGLVLSVEGVTVKMLIISKSTKGPAPGA